MKDSLDHLPIAKQEQLRAIAKLIQDSTEVEMIILFGSYARGDWVEDPIGGYFSDFDILVIVESERLVNKHSVWTSIEDRARRIGRNTALSLIVHDIADVNYQLEQGWFFFSDIKKEGIVLHDSGRHRLAREKKKTPAQRQAYAQQCFDRYFKKANNLYLTHQFCLQNEMFSESAFLLHQATETYYKTVLLVFTAYRPKEHNIESLGKRCGDLHPAFRDVFPRADPDDERRFKLLKAAYVDARYSLNYDISKEDLEILAGHVRELGVRTETACRERIASMAPPPGTAPVAA